MSPHSDPADRVAGQEALSQWEPSWEGTGPESDKDELGGVKELRVGEGVCVHVHKCIHTHRYKGWRVSVMVCVRKTESM